MPLSLAEAIAKIMNAAGFDVVPMEMDLSSREFILELIAEGQRYGEIKMLVNGANAARGSMTWLPASLPR